MGAASAVSGGSAVPVEIIEPTPPDGSDPLENALISKGATSSPKGFGANAPVYGSAEYAEMHRPRYPAAVPRSA